MKTKDVAALAGKAPFALSDAATAMQTPATNTEAYRNGFIAIHMAAIDARYIEFRRKLSMQSKGANFGLEVAVLALTGGGAIAGERLANILSAGGAGLTGTKAALSKEVYFERTLPALLASMEARRIVTKAPIMAGLKQPIADYPLAQAIADLFAYQNSASLDGAIGQITAAAAGEQAAAVATYENVTDTCTPEKNVGDDWKRVRAALNALDPATEKATLDKVSAIVGSATKAAFAEQRTLVMRELVGSYCKRAEMTALIARLTTDAKVTIP